MVWACHMNSPRQKLAISSERNVHIPEAVKIGCDHQSENCFVVHPSNCAFDAARVKSPKCVFIQKSHATIRVAPHRAIVASSRIAPRSLPARASVMHHDKTAPTATNINGRLPSFVRYAAAIDKPVAIPREIVGSSWENHLIKQMNTNPKEIGERTSLLIP